MFSHLIQSFKISSASNKISNALTLSGSAPCLVHSHIIKLSILSLEQFRHNLICSQKWFRSNLFHFFILTQNVTQSGFTGNKFNIDSCFIPTSSAVQIELILLQRQFRLNLFCPQPRWCDLDTNPIHLHRTINQLAAGNFTHAFVGPPQALRNLHQGCHLSCHYD